MFGKNVYRKMFIAMVSVSLIALAVATAVAGTGEPPGGTPPPAQKTRSVSPSLNSDVTFSASAGSEGIPAIWPSEVVITATGQCSGQDVSFGPGTSLVQLPSYTLPDGSVHQITIGDLTAEELEKYFFLVPDNQAAIACYPPNSISYVAPISVTEFQRFINVPVDSQIPNMIVKAKIVWKGVRFTK